MDLFFATSGGYVTMVGDEEIPRGATAKVAAKEKRKAAAIANRKPPPQDRPVNDRCYSS